MAGREDPDAPGQGRDSWLGYVGLPLAVEFAKAGFTVTAIDLSDSKIARINAKDSYVGDDLPFPTRTWLRWNWKESG
jgi:hypothetical protein